jgi:hypothetical protein
MFFAPDRERNGIDDIYISGHKGKGFCVRKLSEYREHAAECRELARTAPPTHRQQLEQMATTWEQLAVARHRKLLRQGNTDKADDDEKMSG